MLFLILLMRLKKERQIKYQKITQALDRIFYFIRKQGISYQETQKAAANSDTLWNPRNFLAIVRQVKHLCLLLYEHIRSTLQNDFFYMSPTSQMNWLALLQNTPFKYD